MIIKDLLQKKEYQQKRVLENLMCHFLSIKREDLWTNIDKELSDDLLNKIDRTYQDFVIKKKPLEYIFGHVEFLGNKFKIDHRALIPRPETEYMIQAVNEFVYKNIGYQNSNSQENILLDIGTGCGVLGLSVLLHNPNYFKEAYLSEYIDYTLSLAKENYEILKPHIGSTKTNLIQSNLLDFLNNNQFSTTNNQLILIANLPYIPEDTFNQNVGENVKNWEPKPAFVGGDDGLDYYREMFKQIFSFIKDGKLDIENGFTMFLEMMTRQVDVLRQEFGQKIQFEEVKTFHFNIRIVKAILK